MARYLCSVPSSSTGDPLWTKDTSVSSKGTSRRNAIIALSMKLEGSKSKSRIVRISLRELFVSERKEGEEWSMPINSERLVLSEDMRGNSDGIVSEDLTFAEAWPCIRSFVEKRARASKERPIIVAQPVDFHHLEGELERLGLGTPDWHFVCTKRLSELVKGFRRIAELLKVPATENEAGHRALGDTGTLARLLGKIDDLLFSTVRQADILLLGSDAPEPGRDRSYKKGDAVRRLLLLGLSATLKRPEKSEATAASAIESTDAPADAFAADPASRTEPASATEPASNLVRVMPGGGFFCTRGAPRFHTNAQCYGLRHAIEIFEIAGPPSDREGCLLCGFGYGTTSSTVSAAAQIETYLQSRREIASSAPSEMSSKPNTRTENTQARPRRNVRTEVSHAVHRRVLPSTEPTSTAEPASNLVRVVPGGGFFCTRGAPRFHTNAQCYGLRSAIEIFEIAGPPSDREGCLLCGLGYGTTSSARSAAAQIEPYLQSRRETSSSVPSELSSKPNTRTENTRARPRRNVRTEVSHTVHRRASKDERRSAQRVTPEMRARKFLYTATGSRFHTIRDCRGLRNARRVYSAGEYPSGLEPCKLCA